MDIIAKNPGIGQWHKKATLQEKAKSYQINSS